MAIKIEKLNKAVEMLNYKLKMPMEMYTENKINAGHFYMDQSYGGYRLQRTYLDGCVNDISDRGSKQEVYDFIKGMLLGIELSKKD